MAGGIRLSSLLVPLLILAIAASSAIAQPTVIGSKKFTENVILGEAATLAIQASGAEALHRRELGGTRILWGALIAGDIDAYPEYSGTLLTELLGGAFPSVAAARDSLAALGLSISGSLGFNNTYVLGMTTPRSTELGISRISDLAQHSDLDLAFTNEFMDREDGWPTLRQTYRLPHTNVRGLDHDLAYRALAGGDVDVIDLYSTDAEIRLYDLSLLEDDRSVFPSYEAHLLYRTDAWPQLRGAVGLLEGAIPQATMMSLNAEVRLDGRTESETAAGFLATVGVQADPASVTRKARILQRTREHLYLVGISLAAAILLAIPLGVIATRSRVLGQVILGVVGAIYTIPSLALLVFMIPLLGIGGPPAMVALFLYSLLPIVRNTHAGISDIPAPLRESAEALSLGGITNLFRIELPLASRSILAGIKTAAVINIGTATLGALIGAGGYGQPILTGIRLDDTALILEGAIPAAALALLAQGIFDVAERVLIPKGLRLRPSR